MRILDAPLSAHALMMFEAGERQMEGVSASIPEKQVLTGEVDTAFCSWSRTKAMRSVRHWSASKGAFSKYSVTARAIVGWEAVAIRKCRHWRYWLRGWPALSRAAMI
jgi:hypothetical protein